MREGPAAKRWEGEGLLSSYDRQPVKKKKKKKMMMMMMMMMMKKKTLTQTLSRTRERAKLGRTRRGGFRGVNDGE